MLLCLGLLGVLRATPLRVVGSDLLGASFSEAVVRFAQDDARMLTLTLRGTRPGLDELQAGRADLGLLLLPPGEKPPVGFIATVIAYQVVVIAVPTDSSLTQLTQDQLRELCGRDSVASGAATLGGVLASAKGLALPLVERVVLNGPVKPAAVTLVEDERGLWERLGRPGVALAFAGLPREAPAGVRYLPLARTATEAAYGPTAEAVHRGDYPLRLPLYAVFRRADAPRLQAVLRFLLSSEALAALRPAQFLGLPSSAHDETLLEWETL